MSMMHRRLLAGALFFALLGALFQIIYQQSYRKPVKMEQLKQKLRHEQRLADKKMEQVALWLASENYEEIRSLSFEDSNHTILVYKNDSLLFWSDNQIAPLNLKNVNWRFKELSNAYGLTRSLVADDFRIVAYLPLKYDYPYENEELVNEFVSFLPLHKEIRFSLDTPASSYAYFDSDNNYLFSFVLPSYPIYKEKYSRISFVFYLIFFLAIFYLLAHLPFLFGKKKFSLKEFLISTFVSGTVLLSLMLLDFPDTFFHNNIFTPFHYSYNTLLRTLTHLSFLSFYFFSIVYLFFYYTGDEVKKTGTLWMKIAGLAVIPPVFFLLLYESLAASVFGSVLEINVLRVENMSFLVAFNYLLFLMWGVGFFMLQLKSRKMLLDAVGKYPFFMIEALVLVLLLIGIYFMNDSYKWTVLLYFLTLSVLIYVLVFFDRFKDSNWLMILWLIIYAFFITHTVILKNNQRKFERYKTLAVNYYLEDPNVEDKLALALIEDLDKSLTWDRVLKELVQSNDQDMQAANYVNETYMRGFWNKYKVHLFVAEDGSSLSKEYDDAISQWGRSIERTHFYIMDMLNSNMSFLAVYHTLNKEFKQVNYYLEFYPQKFHKSYSYPELLLEKQSSISAQLGLSNARYSYRSLASSSGKYRYPQEAEWINRGKARYFAQDENGFRHYVYSPDAYDDIVLSEELQEGFWVYVIYYFYVLLFFLIVSYFARTSYRLVHRNVPMRNTFSSRFLYAFTLLLLLSFGMIFYVSVGFNRQKYMNDHIKKLEQTKTYIQHALQEKYPWLIQLDSLMGNELTFDLQDLSYTYQTDIHVYDNSGKLVASSQMPLFNRELVSKMMAPTPYFSNMENYNQNEHIGKLEYLTAYTDFYNMDYLPIGYIAVPQFLSEDQIRQELLNFLSTIVHIFMIIMLLFVVLSIVIGRQLSVPLVMLEESLREMKVGHSIRKINYKPNDEIGQLVDQYNKTVEELEESIRQLAQSERETAWKTMARQVAHEINNPLTPMKLTLQQLQRRKEMNDEQFDEYFDKASVMLIEQIENLSRIAGSFSNFARLPDTKYGVVDVGKVLSSVVTLFESNHESIELKYEEPEGPLTAFSDREQLMQVFNNLLKNAEQAIPSGRRGKIEVNICGADEERIVVCVSDNGKGIPEEIREKLFMPNFTTKSTGMGLGLAISRNMVQLMGGEITFETKMDEGTRFRVELPKGG